MSIIKFRIWDGEKYNYPEANENESNHYLQFGSNGFWLFDGTGKMITNSVEGGICEQFTGIKDKKGNEIFEGDICELEVDFFGSKNDFYEEDPYHWILTGVVKFMPSKGFYLKIFKGVNIDGGGEEEDIFTNNDIVQYRTKVIGNIHEK